MLKTRGEVLRLERIFRAPRRLVFAAVTEPALMRRWMCPDSYHVAAVDAEAADGGRFSLAMRGADGTVHEVTGEYREVVPPERVVFTWTWAPGHTMAGVETVVTIELREVEDGTLFAMTHAGLRDPEERESHRGGWTNALAKLQRLTESEAR